MFSEELEKIDWDETTAAIYAKTDADAQQPIPGRIPPPRKHLMQIDLADAGPAGQLRFGQILRFVKSRQPRQAV